MGWGQVGRFLRESPTPVAASADVGGQRVSLPPDSKTLVVTYTDLIQSLKDGIAKG